MIQLTEFRVALFTIGLGWLLFSPTCEAASAVCDFAQLDPAAVAKVEHYYRTTADPERELGVKLKSLGQSFLGQLTPREVEELTQYFHGYLVKATTNPDGTPNSFASDNLKHVSLHYRDLENSKDEINRYFGSPGDGGRSADLALMVAAAHDLGKISETSGLISPGVNQVYSAAVKDLPPGVAFFIKTILGHDGLSMDGIEQAVGQYAKDQNWSAEKTETVIKLLKASIARHNAGYGTLADDPAQGIEHFWQNKYRLFIDKMEALGLKLPREYPAAAGGWMPGLLAMVDRGTSLHPSFVEKIAGQGGFAWNGKSVGTLLRGNARSVRQEIDAIAKELNSHVAEGKRIEDFGPYRRYLQLANEAESLGERILAMNDFSQAYPGRPEVDSSEIENYVYYAKQGVWYRVHGNGLLQRFNPQGNGAWQIETVNPGFNAPQILMQTLIGYPAINTNPPGQG